MDINKEGQLPYRRYLFLSLSLSLRCSRAQLNSRASAWARGDKLGRPEFTFPSGRNKWSLVTCAHAAASFGRVSLSLFFFGVWLPREQAACVICERGGCMHAYTATADTRSYRSRSHVRARIYGVVIIMHVHVCVCVCVCVGRDF